jgi:hypothetical protein
MHIQIHILHALKKLLTDEQLKTGEIVLAISAGFYHAYMGNSDSPQHIDVSHAAQHHRQVNASAIQNRIVRS